MFTVAGATPASRGSMPEVPAFIDGAIVAPMPIPVSHAIPADAISMPANTRGFAPTRGCSYVVHTPPAITRVATIGRNATPVMTGEYRRIPCM